MRFLFSLCVFVLFIVAVVITVEYQKDMPPIVVVYHIPPPKQECFCSAPNVPIHLEVRGGGVGSGGNYELRTKPWWKW